MSDKDIQISESYDRLGVEGQGESQDENLVCQGQEVRVKDRSVRPRTFTERGREYHIDCLTRSFRGQASAISAFSNQAYEMLSAEVLVENELLATRDWLKKCFRAFKRFSRSSTDC